MSGEPTVYQRQHRQLKRLERQFEVGGGEHEAAIQELLHPTVRLESIGVYGVHDSDSSVLRVPQFVAIAHESQKGSRLVQKAFTSASPDEMSRLCWALRGFVSPLTTSKNGNHVIQHVLKMLEGQSDAAQSIAREISHDLERVITDRFGYRVLQRVVEQLNETIPESDVRCQMVAWIVDQARLLSQHEYAHFPVETLLETLPCDSRFVAKIIQELLSEDLIRQGSTCFVVTKIIDLNLLPKLTHLMPLMNPEALGSWNDARDLDNTKRRQFNTEKRTKAIADKDVEKRVVLEI